MHHSDDIDVTASIRRRDVLDDIRQRETAELLRANGAADLAGRLERCATARRSRGRTTWPWACKTAGCSWCGRRTARRWWRGLSLWSMASADPLMLAQLPPRLDLPLLSIAPQIRRALRDLRDRAARADRRWAGLAIAGMVDSTGSALLLVRHPDLSQAAVARAIARRWPGARCCAPDPAMALPDFDFCPEAAATLACARRGVEPLRVVIMPRMEKRSATPPAEYEQPLPFIVAG